MGISGTSARSAVSRVERERRRVMGSTSSSRRRRGRDGTVAPRNGWMGAEREGTECMTDLLRSRAPPRAARRRAPYPAGPAPPAIISPPVTPLELIWNGWRIRYIEGAAGAARGQRVHPDPRVGPARRGDLHRPPRDAHVRHAQRLPVHDRAPDGPAVPGDRGAGGAGRRRGRRAVADGDRRRHRVEGRRTTRAGSTSGSTSDAPPAAASASTSTSTSCRAGPATATS